MYMRQMMSVGKCANGFIVEVQVPLKPEKKGESNKMDCCVSSSAEKQYICKDEKEVAATITKLMPLLDMDHKNEDSFDNAFAEATKMPKGEMKDMK